MDPAAIIADLASAHFSMSQVAARHGLSLEALAAFITSDQAQQKLDQLQSAAAIHTRLIAQLHLPVAAAALTTILQSHRAAAITTSPAQQSSPFNNARQDSPPGAPIQNIGTSTTHDDRLTSSTSSQPNPSAARDQARALRDEARSSRDEARALRHQIELRRAAATFLRFANFNHRALARAHTTAPRYASAPPEPSRMSEPRHANTVSQTPRAASPPEPSRACSPPEPAPWVSLPPEPPLNRTQSVEAHAAPAATTPRSASPIPATPAADTFASAPTSAHAPDPASTLFPPSTSTASSALSSYASASSTSLLPLSPSSIPFPIPALPSSIHLDPSYHSPSSSPLFLRASVPRWFVPSSSRASRSPPSAARRLTSTAGASTHPP